MSRYRVLGVLVVVLVLIAGCGSSATPTTVTRGKVLLIAPEISMDMEYMLTNEVGVMVSMLQGAGFKVVVASQHGFTIGGAGKAALKPDLKLADVKPADYVGFMLPCLENAQHAAPPGAAEIVGAAVALGRPVAAQHEGVRALLDAGVLTGKRFAMAEDPKVSSAIYSGDGVVQDGNISTSGSCPESAKLTAKKDGTAELTQKLIDALASVR